MAQVQYNPVSDVGVEARPTPSMHVNTPGEAFGTGIAKAVEHFGGNLEHAGNELFVRAMAIQHLNNEAETRDKDAEFILKSGKLYGEYESLQGKNAVDAQPQFEKNITQLRKSLRNNLSNPMSQKMFDAQTQTSMARIIFSSWRHMADANKKWQVSTIDSNIDARESEALNNPKDENAFQETLRNVRFDVERKANILGVDPGNLISHHISQLWGSRILGLNKTNPMAAQEMLDYAVSNRLIRGQEAIKLTPIIQGKVDDIIIRNGSDATNAGWSPAMPQIEIDKTVGLEEGLSRVLKKVSRDRPDLKFTIGPREDGDDKGMSISLIPLVNGKPDPKVTAEQQKLSTAMYEAAAALKIPLSTEITGKGSGVYTLPQDYDPRKIPKEEPESERSRVNRVKAWAREQRPEDIVFQNRAAERTMGDYSREIRQKRDEEYNDINILRGVLQNGYGPGGKLPTTVEELTSTPEAEAAWNRLDPKHRQSFYDLMNRTAKGDVAETPERRSRFEELRGLSITNPARFLDTNLNDLDLPKSMRDRLWNLQYQTKQKIDKGEATDPRVTHALQVLGGANILYPARISKSASEATYNKFVGNLAEELRAYRDEHKKPPSDDEIRKIGTRLLMTTPEPGRFFGENQTRVFELKVPKDVETAIKNDPAWLDTGMVPTPEKIQQIYVRSQYQRLYEKKETGLAPAKAPEPPEQLKPQNQGPKQSAQVIESIKRSGLLTKEQQRAKPKPKMEGKPIIDTQGSGPPSTKVEDRRSFDPTMTPEEIEKRRRNREMADRVLR